jgi:hypothetical protein
MNRSTRPFVLVAAFQAIGCVQEPGSPPHSDPRSPASELRVTIADETVESPQPVALNFSFRNGLDSGVSELSWSAGQGEETSLVLRVPYLAWSDRSVRAELVAGPLMEDRASGNLFVRGTPGTGTIHVSLSDGRSEGSAEDLELTFEGTLVISCSVPASSLDGSEVAAPVAENGEAALVDDPEFRSPECAAVRKAFM